MDAFIGSIIMFSGNFAPKGWAFCNGQLMSISQNSALFSILGTTYGGDGVSTFALPNLQSRIPMHPGQGPGLSTRVLGQVAGEENVTLLVTQMPMHNHLESFVPSGASSTADSTSPIGNFPAPVLNPDGSGFLNAYSSTSDGLTGAKSGPSSASTGIAGGGQPHDNMPPFLCVNFIIALVGIYPARN